MEPQIILFLLNALMVVVTFFGGVMLRKQSEEINDLRQADVRMVEKLENCVRKDEFSEFRQEQRSNFERMFDKLDDIKEQVSKKVDRNEVNR